MQEPYAVAPRVRVVFVRDGATPYAGPIRSAADIWRLLKDEAQTWDRERFLSLLLDARHRAIGLEEVSVGTATASLVHPRELFKAAILANASAMILVHNHPSGDPIPSGEDRDLTRRIREAADLIGIRLLDHVVLGEGAYHSFAEAGEL